MIVNHTHKFIFLKTRKTASTSIDMALSRHCGDADVISYMNPEDEALKKRLGLRPAQNFMIPFDYWTLSDIGRFLFRGRRPRYTEHMTADSLMRRIQPKVWRSYFKFCVERNPFDKAVSLYYWRTRGQATRPSLEEFLRNVEPTSLSNFYIYASKGGLHVDYLIRYEKLEQGLRAIADRLGVGRMDLPQAKGGIRQIRTHYREIMTPEARSIVERVCAQEIELLDYQF